MFNKRHAVIVIECKVQTPLVPLFGIQYCYSKSKQCSKQCVLSYNLHMQGLRQKYFASSETCSNKVLEKMWLKQQL